MQPTYQAKMYAPELVTGKYVRVEGKRGNYQFKVFETATCLDKKSRFYGRAGMGFTLREYMTTGDKLPEELKQRCIKSKTTERWE